MLQKLIIRNYAIIDRLTLEPDAHLNIVTGETGAGKSIILGALGLILGERADTSVLINKDEKCVVEAYFEVRDHQAFRQALKETELDEEPVCIIRREIGSNGKSRAFVNDTPVTLQVLNNLTSMLVDLHRQFDHLALEDGRFQLEVLDAVAQNTQVLQEYGALYRQYRKISQERQQLQSEQLSAGKEADYKQYLLDELVQASFKENEIEEAEGHLKQMTHAERIISTLQLVRFGLEEGELPVNNELKRMSQQLQGITDLLPGVQPLLERMNSAFAELKDIASELEMLEGGVNIDPALMQQMQERTDLGYKLFKKHSVSSTAALLEIQAQLELDLSATFNMSERIDVLTREQERIFGDLKKIGGRLSANRAAVAPVIAEKVNGLLTLVGMPNARFEIRVLPQAELLSSGMDAVQFLLDANRSGQMQPVHKAASGGEMSRIMLCIKSLTAKAMHLPTLIFDEVDTGISGEAARQVGMLLQSLGDYHQVICITHQPQVAAKGSRHFFVYKEEGAGQRITTQIRMLDSGEKVISIARMIGGEHPSEAAMQNALELVNG